MKKLLTVTILFFIISCKKSAPQAFKSVRELTPITFIENVKSNATDSRWFVLENDFPKQWVKKEDLSTLISLLDSKEKCKCYLNPLSSHLPDEDAEVGGYAAEFITAYMENRPPDFGLYSCPKIKEKDLGKIRNWWSEHKNQTTDFTEKAVDFAIENPNGKFIEFPDLYDSLSKEIVAKDENEKLILAQILKKKGFEITNWGRGNHPLGPRIIELKLQRNDCECEVQKTYYATDSLPEKIYKTTESIKCKKISR